MCWRFVGWCWRGVGVGLVVPPCCLSYCWWCVCEGGRGGVRVEWVLDVAGRDNRQRLKQQIARCASQINICVSIFRRQFEYNGLRRRISGKHAKF
eukprot:SAG11_NODE_102_length_16709_cov_31.066093_22_plen_95_part_00